MTAEPLRLEIEAGRDPAALQALLQTISAGEGRAVLSFVLAPDAPAAVRELAAVHAAPEAAAATEAQLRLPAGVVVSPDLVDFATAARAAYAGEPRIAGLSFGTWERPAADRLVFDPLDDGGDVVFVEADAAVASLDFGRPGGLRVFPRSPLVVAPGAGRTGSSLALGRRDWRLPALGEALAIYDADFELSPQVLKRLAPVLADYDFDVDLFGRKAAGGAPLRLSSKPCRAPVLSFGMEMAPLEANIIQGIEGEVFSLGAQGDFAPMTAKLRGRLNAHLARVTSLVDYAGQFLKKG